MKVMSSSGIKFYEVTSHSCTCPDYVYRQAKSGGKCKHMIKFFYPQIGGVEPEVEFALGSRTIEFFRGGAEIDDSYAQFGEKKIKELIGLGEICKHKVKGKTMFYLLE